MIRSTGRRSVSGTVHPPCSKSYAQRALAVSLLASGTSTIRNIQLCDDTRHAIDAIRGLGAEVVPLDGHTLSVTGGLDPRSDRLDTGESGLATRLFTPIASLSEREITVTGRGTMLRRPIGMMIKPLENLGVDVKSDGFLPITVKGPLRGGESEVDGYVSSQFLTGLMIALPRARQDTTLFVEHPNSIPYLAMTADVVRTFGARIDHTEDFREFFIPATQSYEPAAYDIEGDWSSAAFMLVAGAMAGQVTVANMNPLSLQADVAIIDILSHVGARITTTRQDITVCRNNLNAFDFDATHCPDLFPVLAVLGANCEGKSTVRGASRLIHKESNRAAAILSEFRRIGIDVRIDGNVMTVRGGKIKGGAMESCGDHRIAMAGAIAGLTAAGEVAIEGAEAVSKSYPAFWDDLESISIL